MNAKLQALKEAHIWLKSDQIAPTHTTHAPTPQAINGWYLVPNRNLEKKFTHRGYSVHEYTVRGADLVNMTDEEIVEVCDNGYNYGYTVRRYNDGLTAEVSINID